MVTEAAPGCAAQPTTLSSLGWEDETGLKGFWNSTGNRGVRTASGLTAWLNSFVNKLVPTSWSRSASWT